MNDEQVMPYICSPLRVVTMVGKSAETKAQLREELRQRLNDAPGLSIPAAKIDLYPNFPVTLLTDVATWDVVVGALDWFADQTKRADS